MTSSTYSYEEFRRTAAPIYAALTAIGKAVDDTGLEKSLTELVKLRVSQINGCAFCMQHHLTVARHAGVAAEKIDLLAGWRDAGIFSERERAALGWAESLTGIAQSHPDAAALATAQKHFSHDELLFLTVAIGQINMWNRIGAGLHLPPGLPRKTAGQAA
ncbi:MAG: carboxymuconolactone decarboxylase family protein [Variibacter sp.]